MSEDRPGPQTLQASALFATPLWSFRHPDLNQLQSWCDHVLELECKDRAGLQLTNQGGWHSQNDLLADPALGPLFLWMATCTQQAMAEFGWDMSKATPCFNNAWAMVNREGHSVRAHLHPNSLFSGVVYLAAPEDCGAIAFLDPRSGAQVLLPPLLPAAGAYATGRILRQPQPGLMFLFPGWLWHEVERSHSSQPRICVSFNIGMRVVRAGGTAQA